MVFNCMKIIDLCQIYLAEGLFDREQAISLLKMYQALDAHAQEWVRKIIMTGGDDTSSPWMDTLNRLLILAIQLSRDQLELLEMKIEQVADGKLSCPPCTEEVEEEEEESTIDDEVVYDLCACDLIWLIQQIGQNGCLCGALPCR